jgi:hypothetical protein
MVFARLISNEILELQGLAPGLLEFLFVAVFFRKWALPLLNSQAITPGFFIAKMYTAVQKSHVPKKKKGEIHT